MNNPTPRVVVYLLLALTALVIAHRGSLVRRAPDQRLIVYALDQPIEMALSAGDTAVRIVSWLEGKAPDLLDAYRSWPYAIRTRVLDEDAGPIVDQTAWLTTRVGFVPDEPTLVPTARANRGQMYTDDRLIVLPFDAPLNASARLRIEADSVPPGMRIGFAAFRATERTPLVQERLRLQQHRDAPHLLAPLSPFGFPELGETRSARLVLRSWQRLGAITRLGRAPERMELYTAFDDNSLDESTARAWPMRPGQIASMSVRGPTTVTARWLHPGGAGPTAVDTWVRQLGPGGHVDRLERLGFVTEIGPIAVDDVGTVEIGVDPSQARPALLVIESHGGALLGDPPWLAMAGDGRISVPDAVRIEAWRVGPRAPVRFPVRPGDRLRLVARQPLPPDGPQAFAPPQLGYEARLQLDVIDALGRILTTWTPALPAIPSPYDRYTHADDPSVHALSEAAWYTIDAPANAAELRIATHGGEADLRLLRFEPDAPPYEVQRPWADLPLPLGPLPPRFTAWAAVAPLNVEGLVREGRMMGWLLQIRPKIDDPRPGIVSVPSGAEAPAWVANLKQKMPVTPIQLGTPATRPPRPEPPIRPSTPTRPATPVRRPRKPSVPRTLLELARPFDLLVREEAGDGRAVGASPTEVVVGASGVLELDHRLPTRLVGARIVLTVGGRVETRVAHASAGRWRFEELPPEPLLVRVDADGTFVARDQPLGDRLVQRVWRLTSGEHARIALPPTPSVSVITWAPGRTSGRLDWRLGGGDSPQQGTLALSPGPDRATPLSWEGAALMDQPDLVIHDATPGEQWLEIYVATASDVFVRVLVEAMP